MKDYFETHRANHGVKSSIFRLPNSGQLRGGYSLVNELFCEVCNILPLRNFDVSIASWVKGVLKALAHNETPPNKEFECFRNAY